MHTPPPGEKETEHPAQVTHCWEFKQCAHLLCPMYLNDTRCTCYYVSGTRGAGIPETITAKSEQCKRCEFYRAHEQHSHDLREKVLQRLRALEGELHSLFTVSPEEKAAIFQQRAAYLSTRLHTHEPEEKVRLLTFSLGNEHYCMRIRHALEIITAPAITTTPCTPSHFAGIINVRGSLLTLVDLRVVLQIENNSPPASSAIIVIEVDGEAAGVVVDKVEHIIDVGMKQIVPPLATIKGIKEEFIEGEVLTGAHPFTLLNLERMMRHESMRVFETVATLTKR